MSPSPIKPVIYSVRIFRSFPARILMVLAAVVILLVALSGCGGGDQKDTILATVGQTEIKAGYYEDRLIRLEENELPRGDDGSILDMALLEGKEKFLETLINKEVMVQKAQAMGLDNDSNIVDARQALSSYEAGLNLWAKVIQEPANTISIEELEAFYAKMGSSRKCQYIICNFKEDAEAAHQAAVEGTDWEDIILQYHDGEDTPDGVYEIQVPFGRYAPDFENGVFGVEIGGITPPINSVYGYWVMKVLGEKPGKKPPLEDAKAQILDLTQVRKKSHLKKEFVESIREKFELTIHEDALWKCYQGLPSGETLFREGTQDPRKKDELTPLDIATEDFDMPFYSYLGREGKVESTLLDFKIRFDEMNVFQRPKKTDLLGGLRDKIKQGLDTTLLDFEAQDQGMYEETAVKTKVDLKIEEMIVNKLYAEVVVIDEQVTPEQMEAFWAEHSQDYYASENRTGRLVICRNAALAAEAKAKATDGTAWGDILVEYGVDVENKSRAGNLVKVFLTEDEPISGALFNLQPGAVSEPFDLGDGRFGVVLLESVEPQRSVEMSEVTETLGHRIKERRKEEMFQAKLAQWKEDIAVVIHKDRLDGLASWKELQTAPEPENVVPRN